MRGTGLGRAGGESLTSSPLDRIRQNPKADPHAAYYMAGGISREGMVISLHGMRKPGVHMEI